MWRKAADVTIWLGTSVYFGGLVTLGVVAAPAVFASSANAHLSMPGIAAPPLNMSNQVGGEIFGEVLNRFAWVQLIGLALILVGLAVWFLGHKMVRRSTWVLVILWILLAALTAYDIGVLRPRVFVVRDAVREKAKRPPPPTMPAGPLTSADWPEQVEFNGLHDRSEAIAHWEAYVLLGMILVAAWRGLAEKKPSHAVPAP